MSDLAESDDDLFGAFGGGAHDDDDDDDDEHEHNSDSETKRRDVEWRMVTSLLKRGKTDALIDEWRERALKTVSEDGSGTTNGRRIIRGDGAIVHEKKCSLGFRLGCPWRCRLVETEDHLVLEVRRKRNRDRNRNRNRNRNRHRPT